MAPGYKPRGIINARPVHTWHPREVGPASYPDILFAWHHILAKREELLAQRQERMKKARLPILTDESEPLNLDAFLSHRRGEYSARICNGTLLLEQIGGHGKTEDPACRRYVAGLVDFLAHEPRESGMQCDPTNKAYDVVIKNFAYGDESSGKGGVDIFLLHEGGATAIDMIDVPLVRRKRHLLDRWHKLRKVFGEGTVSYTLISDFHSDAQNYRSRQQIIDEPTFSSL
jgi:hypothetical protein